MSKNLLIVFHNYDEFKGFINKVYDIMQKQDYISSEDFNSKFSDNVKSIVSASVDLSKLYKWERVISLNKLPDRNAFSVIFTSLESNIESVIEYYLNNCNLEEEIVNDLKTICRIYSKY